MPRAKKKPAAVPPATPAALVESAAPGAVLLGIDLQSTLLRALPAAASRALQARASLAIAGARELGIPVVFSEQVPAKLGPTSPALLRLAPGAPVFAKNTFSALADDALLGALRDLKAEHLLICGLETPICVYQTALGALAEGLQVTVLADAVGARRPDDHAACLSALRHAGVHVLPVETVFYALLHDTAHPLFKNIVALVKARSAET